MEELNSAIELLSKVGVPLAITAGVLYVLFRTVAVLPRCMEDYFQDTKKRNEKYDDQMRIITIVAQQGVEAQRRGNEIIERNNIVMDCRNKSDEKLLEGLVHFAERLKTVEEITSKNTEMVQHIFTESLKMSRT